MSTGQDRSIPGDGKMYLSFFQDLLSLPRETVPQVTSVAARGCLERLAPTLDLEFIEIKGVAPTFLLLPRGDAPPDVTVLASWHGEAEPVTPAAAEGGERLALAAAASALVRIREDGIRRPSLVVPPAAGHGSLPLLELLREHRPALQAPVAFWPRAGSIAPGRRRVFLGARGRVILGIWGEANPYALRDRLVSDLRDEAFGPRPLDFELLRKLAQSPDALDFLEETIEDPATVAGEGEARLRSALFEPRGFVRRPPVRHPDRPQAWIAIELAEAMEPTEIARRAQSFAEGSRIEAAESIPWDRQNIHHPAIQALIQTSKTRSQGAEIWPSAPWVTPSGLFTRALGTPLSEWTAPLPPGSAIRAPSPAAFQAIEAEFAEIFLRGTGVLSKGSPPSSPESNLESASG